MKNALYLDSDSETSDLGSESDDSSIIDEDAYLGFKDSDYLYLSMLLSTTVSKKDLCNAFHCDELGELPKHINNVRIIEISVLPKKRCVWPPVLPVMLIFIVSLLTALYPLWAILLWKYQEDKNTYFYSSFLSVAVGNVERYNILFFLDMISTWVLEKVPILVSELLALHISLCIIYAGLCQHELINR